MRIRDSARWAAAEAAEASNAVENAANWVSAIGDALMQLLQQFQDSGLEVDLVRRDESLFGLAVRLRLGREPKPIPAET